MTFSEALAWQALLIFIVAFVTIATAFCVWPLPGDRKFWHKALLTISIILFAAAFLMWNATLWINYYEMR